MVGSVSKMLSSDTSMKPLLLICSVQVTVLGQMTEGGETVCEISSELTRVRLAAKLA